MGFLDRAKKLAEQAKEATEQAKRLAAQVSSMTGANSPPGQAAPVTSTPAQPVPSPPQTSTAPARPGAPAALGTPYVPGMLGRPGWREMGLTDPAAMLPISEREQAGLPHTTKSRILEEPFGMGRRWSCGNRSAALFYQLYPEHQGWDPPGGKAPLPEVPGATMASLPDGRILVFVPGPRQSVVLEVQGIEGPARAGLARTVAERMAAV